MHLTLFRQIADTVWRFLVRGHLVFLLVPFYLLFVIKEKTHDGSFASGLRGAFLRSDHRVRILALGAEGFRGDLDLLARNKRFRVFAIPRKWQTRLISCFYSFALQSDDIRAVRHHRSEDAPSDQTDLRFREAMNLTQKFLKPFLALLYRILRIDIVLVYNVRYLPDLDWAQVSKDLGILYVMIFREIPNFLTEYETITRERHSQYGRFRGHYILVANEKTRDVFVKSGFAFPAQVIVSGVMRMDMLRDWVRKIPKANHKPVQLMMVWWSIGLYESDEFLRLSHEVLDVFVELSVELPDVQFLIKPTIFQASKSLEKKSRLNTDYMVEASKSATRQLDLERELNRRRPGWSDCSNLSIDPLIDMHDAILNSTVVCGIQSVSLVEAAVAGRPVIVPFFDYFANSPVGAQYQFRHHLEILDVSADKVQFKDMIKNRLKNPSIGESQEKARWDHFRLHVSDLSESSVENVTNALCAMAEERQRKKFNQTATTSNHD